MGGGSVGISGYSSLAPSSQSKIGQHSGKGAVLFVFSDSLHLGFAFGNGPQSSTSSNKRPELSSAGTQVDRPQNGVRSHDFVGSMVAHLVEAKHMPGKSRRTSAGMSLLYVFGRSSSFSSAAKTTTATTSNKTGNSFMATVGCKRRRIDTEEGGRGEEKIYRVLVYRLRTGWARFSCRHFIAAHGAGSCGPHQTLWSLTS